jgi:branched-chain amino acid transport system permease protein
MTMTNITTDPLGKAKLGGLRPAVVVIAGLLVCYLLSTLLGFYGLYLLTLIGIFGIVATGLTMFIGYTGQLSIGHAAFFGLGAYTAANVGKLGFGFPLAILAGGAASLAFGYALGTIALRLRGFYLAVMTLAIGLIATQLFKNLDVFTGGVSGMGGMPRAAIAGVRVDAPASYFLVSWVMVIAVLFLSWVVARSPAGLVMRAIAGNELAAQSVGISTFMLKIHVFALSTFYAGIAGGLYAHLVRFITPDHFSFNYSIEFLTMGIVGGLRNIFGGIIGAAVILIAAEELRPFPQWQPILYGVTLILVAMVMPGGIAGLIAASTHWIRTRQSDVNRGAETE